MPTSKNRLARIIRRSHAPLALALAGMLALAGCGVDVIRLQPVSTPTPAAAAPAGEEADPTTSSTETSGDTTEPVESNPSASHTGEPTELDLARRSYYADKVDVTTGCPGGELVLDQSMRVTKLTEPCERVVVTESFNTLLAGEVGTLEIRDGASHGYFLIGQLGKATVEAPFSTVYWDTGNPKLAVTGFKCVIKPNPVKE